MKKLSKSQIEVLEFMRNGWQLGSRIQLKEFHKRFWLQKGGCGKGGESKKVSSKTAYFLIENNLIEVDDSGYGGQNSTYREKK